MPPVITLTTDFGPGSCYVAAMKGVILAINPAVRLVDLTHSIGPQDVRQGAWFLADAAHWFPADTIHVAVVDPGVGTERSIIYARIDEHHYLAPDNGLDPKQLGPRQADMLRLEWRRPRVEPGKITGSIASIDFFGNLITDIGLDILTPAGMTGDPSIQCAGETIRGLVRTYADQPEQTLVALVGSSGFLELSVVRGSAAQRLAVKTGDPVTIVW